MQSVTMTPTKLEKKEVRSILMSFVLKPSEHKRLQRIARARNVSMSNILRAGMFSAIEYLENGGEVEAGGDE